MLGKELADCMLKIGRAEVHAKTVNDEILDWEQAEPYILSNNVDSQGYRYSVKVSFNLPYRDRWSLIVGDCIHNLRCALDQLVYAIAVRESGIDPPLDERLLQFPITDSPGTFANEGRRIKSLSQTVRTSIERVQPYNRPDRFLPPLLSLIQYFDNRDKHKLLNVAISKQQVGEGEVDLPFVHRIRNITTNQGDIVDGAEIVTFTVDPPYLDVKYKYKAAFTIGLRHPAGPTGIKVTAIRRLLPLLCEETRTVVEIIGSEV